MGVKFSNNGHSTLASSITSSDTSITVASGHGARFPSLGAGDYFFATLIDASNNLEIVKCTARSSDVLTVTRGQESTTARAYAIGDRIELRVTAAGLNAVYTEAVADAIPGTDTITAAMIQADAVGSSEIASNAVGASELNVSGNGTSGQSLLSDGDGTMSWGAGGKVLQQKTSWNTTKHSTSASMGTYYENTSSTQGTQVASVSLTRQSSTSTIFVWAHSAGQVGGNQGMGMGIFAGTTRLAMSLANGYAADIWGCSPHAAIASSVVGSGAVTYQARLLGSRDGSSLYSYQYNGNQNMGNFYSGITVMEVEV